MAIALALVLAAFPAAADARWRKPSAGRLQCVPYARARSGVAIHGNAATWWGQAGGAYARGHAPALGAVLAFRSTARMPAGHVAVVREVLDERHVLLDHANWSRPGGIERAALAEDVSAAGDWSAVRVWHGPSGRLGLRTNPAFGFIYGRRGWNPREWQESRDAAGPAIRYENVIWVETRSAARIRAESVALFDG